jgi:hypothetical protein
MRRLGDTFFSQVAQQMLTPPESKRTFSALPSTAPLLVDWFKGHKKTDVDQQVLGDRAGKIPDVVGMSLRKALLELMPCEVEIEIEGAGRVVAQEPGAGQECGERIRIRLASGAMERSQ